MRKPHKQERPACGKTACGAVGRGFMRKATMRFARGNIRLMFGHYLDKEDVEKMKKEILAHDFTHI